MSSGRSFWPPPGSPHSPPPAGASATPTPARRRASRGWPSHGTPFRDPDEIDRGQAKTGTSRLPQHEAPVHDAVPGQFVGQHPPGFLFMDDGIRTM